MSPDQRLIVALVGWTLQYVMEVPAGELRKRTRAVIALLTDDAKTVQLATHQWLPLGGKVHPRVLMTLVIEWSYKKLRESQDKDMPADTIMDMATAMIEEQRRRADDDEG